MQVTTYTPPFRPPFSGLLENLDNFDPYIWAKRGKYRISAHIFCQNLAKCIVSIPCLALCNILAFRVNGLCWASLPETQPRTTPPPGLLIEKLDMISFKFRRLLIISWHIYGPVTSSNMASKISRHFVWWNGFCFFSGMTRARDHVMTVLPRTLRLSACALTMSSIAAVPTARPEGQHEELPRAPPALQVAAHISLASWHLVDDDDNADCLPLVLKIAKWACAAHNTTFAGSS